MARIMNSSMKALFISALMFVPSEGDAAQAAIHDESMMKQLERLGIIPLHMLCSW